MHNKNTENYDSKIGLHSQVSTHYQRVHSLKLALIHDLARTTDDKIMNLRWVFKIIVTMAVKLKSLGRALNPGPAAYEAAALPSWATEAPALH